MDEDLRERVDAGPSAEATAPPTGATEEPALAARTSLRWSIAFGAAAGVLTALFYGFAPNRSLDYDGSVTVGAFVKTPSIAHAFTRQIEYNNQPVFSAMEHAVWTLGLHSEAALRVFPILFAALTVGLLAGWCARKWGLLAGATVALVVGANPALSDLARSVRGYSLLTFCAVGTTLLAWELLTKQAPGRWVAPCYVALLVVGIGTHFYALIFLGAQAVFVLVRRQLNEAWIKRWLIAVVLGALVYVRIGHRMLSSEKSGAFQRGFMGDLTRQLLGDQAVAVVILSILFLGALWLVRKRADVLLPLLAIAVVAAVIWIILRPQFLAPRFLIWLVPTVAVAVAYVVARFPAAAVLVLIAVVAMIGRDAHYWNATEWPTAEAAARVDAARAQGQTVCGLLSSGEAVLAYTRQPTRARTPQQLADCDVVVSFNPTAAQRKLAQGVLPYSWTVGGRYPAVFYARVPQAQSPAGRASGAESLTTHRRTYP
jgi:hypothetical protein